jgi:hypothetical protein
MLRQVAIMLLLHKDPGADFVGGPRVIKACINILEAAYVHDMICDIQALPSIDVLFSA